MSTSHDIIRVGVVESTMATCRDLVASAEIRTGQAVLARHQTMGRGRSERVWQDVPDSALLMTAFNIVKIEPERIGLLAILAGVVLAEFAESVGVPAQIKWPNDLLVRDRKCAGILIATTPLHDALAVYAGFGLNVASVPPSLASSATFLAAETDTPVLIDEVASSVHQSWNRSLADFSAMDIGDLIRRWSDYAAWVGETVTVQTDEEIVGSVAGIDKLGRLLLNVDGVERALATGDVSRGPRRVS